MSTITMALQFLVSISILIPFLQYCDAAVTTWSLPSSVKGIQGQNITITFVANLSDHDPGTTWEFVGITKDGSPMISIQLGQQKELYSPFDSRSSDLDLNVTQNGLIVTVKFTFSNLVKDTDEGAYTVKAFLTSDHQGETPATAASLVINVPTNITSPNTATVTVNETQTAELECNATGHPTPSINWTRNGVIVGTESPFTTQAVTYDDDKACYTCVAYNGVHDAKTANVCLYVQLMTTSNCSKGTADEGLDQWIVAIIALVCIIPIIILIVIARCLVVPWWRKRKLAQKDPEIANGISEDPCQKPEDNNATATEEDYETSEELQEILQPGEEDPAYQSLVPSEL